MILLVDLDGTIRDTWSVYRRLAQVVLHGMGWPADWREEGPADYWFLMPLHNHPRISQLEALWNKQNLHLHAPPYPGAVEAVKDLANHCELFFVTSPALTNETVWSENRAWIEYYFGATWLPRLIQTYDKTMVHGDILIDDKPAIHGVLQPEWQHILFNQPCNGHVNKPRIYSWDNPGEVLQLCGTL